MRLAALRSCSTLGHDCPTSGHVYRSSRHRCRLWRCTRIIAWHSVRIAHCGEPYPTQRGTGPCRIGNAPIHPALPSVPFTMLQHVSFWPYATVFSGFFPVRSSPRPSLCPAPRCPQCAPLPTVPSVYPTLCPHRALLTSRDAPCCPLLPPVAI